MGSPNNTGTPRELTMRAVVLGTLLTVVFGAANAYLGLKAGMTVSASIPAAVMSMAILRAFCRNVTILENNMVQTIASSGESLAAGIIFTIPALFLMGMAPPLIKIFVISLIGGFLGIFFMIPLRRYLIVREHGKLPFPEGTACAEVLKAGESGGARAGVVGLGLGIGGAFQFLMNGLKLWKGDGLSWTIPNLHKATIGVDTTPALLGVGFIIGPKIALTMFAGGVLGWLVLIPLIDALGNILPAYIPVSTPIANLEADNIWRSYIKFIGAGAVALGGMVSLARAMPVVIGSIRIGLRKVPPNESGGVERTDRDLPFSLVLSGAALSIIAVFVLLQIGENAPLANFAVAVAVVLFGFLFVTVAAQTVGLVGSSSNPVSGMTITTLIVISLLLVWLGWTETGGAVIALTVGAVVCIAVCMSGDIAQDLKTGYLVGSTPAKQQIGEFIGVVAPALVIGLLLFPIHEKFGFDSKEFSAPQATLMKTVVEGIMGGNLPWTLVLVGVVIAGIVELMRIPSLPFAIGLYLPISLSVPIVLGGFVAYLARTTAAGGWKEREDRGILFSSGLVAGDALIGVVIVLLSTIPLGAGTLIGRIAVGPLGGGLHTEDALSAGMFLLLVFALWKIVTRRKPQTH